MNALKVVAAGAVGGTKQSRPRAGHAGKAAAAAPALRLVSGLPDSEPKSDRYEQLNSAADAFESAVGDGLVLDWQSLEALRRITAALKKVME